MMLRPRVGVLVLAILVLAITSAAANAQTSTPIDDSRVDRNAPTAPPDAAVAAPEAAIRVEAGNEAAPPIRNIEFEGTAVPSVVAKAAERFVGEPATRANLVALAASMSAAYERSEVALFTIAIPEQDLSSGTVRVLVAEGHVEAVILTGEVEGRRLALVRRYADQLTHERPTKRRTLERYLSLIQDIPGLRVTPKLQMGQGRGGVRLVLQLDHQRPKIGFGFDNRTTRLIRDGQFTGTAVGYGLVREGDETQLNAVSSVNFSDLLFVGLLHSTAIGGEGTRLSLNGGLLRTRPKDTNRAGEAQSAGIVVSHPLIRSYRRNLTVSFAFDGIDSEGAAFGSVISTERTRSARLAVAFAQTGQPRTISAGLTASKGLDVFDAEVPATIGKATFAKFNGRAALDQAVGRRAALRLRTSAQFTRDPLPAVERFSVGGAAFGRAFEVGVISADLGVAGLAEVAWKPVRTGRFAASELYGFVDGAVVRLLERPGFAAQRFDLASAGAGARLAWTDKAMIELEYAHTLDRPFSGYPSDWRVSISWKLSLRP